MGLLAYKEPSSDPQNKVRKYAYGLPGGLGLDLCFSGLLFTILSKVCHLEVFISCIDRYQVVKSDWAEGCMEDQLGMSGLNGKSVEIG
jgi:hypothetical protein